jgi:hypothetical protein
MDIRGECGFSSLMKQNKKAKICFVICFAGKKKLLFYIYAVIVKQIFYKRSSNYYSLTYEWQDNDEVKHVTTWSKAVRNTMIRGGAEYHRQKALIRAGNNWRDFMGSTDIGLQRIKQAASVGAHLGS